MRDAEIEREIAKAEAHIKRLQQEHQENLKIIAWLKETVHRLNGEIAIREGNMNENAVLCKILEKRYDYPTEGWVLVDIVDSGYQLADDLPNMDRGEIFGWTTRKAVDAELERTGYVVKCPLMECGDEQLIAMVSRYVIPIEWQPEFFSNPEVQSRLFYCTKAS